MRDESNPTLQNLVTAKNVGKILTSRHGCSDDCHSEYRRQQVTCLCAAAQDGDQIWIKVVNTDAPRPGLTRVGADYELWLFGHLHPYEDTFSVHDLQARPGPPVSKRQFGRCDALGGGTDPDHQIDQRSLVVDLVTMLSIVERVRTIRPIHFRHAISSLEEIWNHKRADVQAIRCLRMSPNHNRPFLVEDRGMLGPNRKIALRAAQTTRPEINRTTGRLGLRGF